MSDVRPLAAGRGGGDGGMPSPRRSPRCPHTRPSAPSATSGPSRPTTSSPSASSPAPNHRCPTCSSTPRRGPSSRRTNQIARSALLGRCRWVIGRPGCPATAGAAPATNAIPIPTRASSDSPPPCAAASDSSPSPHRARCSSKPASRPHISPACVVMLVRAATGAPERSET